MSLVERMTDARAGFRGRVDNYVYAAFELWERFGGVLDRDGEQRVCSILFCPARSVSMVDGSQGVRHWNDGH